MLQTLQLEVQVINLLLTKFEVLPSDSIPTDSVEELSKKRAGRKASCIWLSFFSRRKKKALATTVSHKRPERPYPRGGSSI